MVCDITEGSIPSSQQILNILIMTKEMKAFVILVASLLLFIIMLPLTITIAVIRLVRGILNVIEKTLTFFIQSVREELIK